MGSRPKAAPSAAAASAIRAGMPKTRMAIVSAEASPTSAAQCARTWRKARSPRRTTTGMAATSADPRRLPLTGEYTCVQVIYPALPWDGDVELRGEDTPLRAGRSRPVRPGINPRATMQTKSRVNPAPPGGNLILEPASAGFCVNSYPGHPRPGGPRPHQRLLPHPLPHLHRRLEAHDLLPDPGE